MTYERNLILRTLVKRAPDLDNSVSEIGYKIRLLLLKLRYVEVVEVVS